MQLADRDKNGQELLELQVFHPRREEPTSPSNLALEGYVREVVSHTDRRDLLMRFFGWPNMEAIPGRITGRIADQHEQPRDAVIVAFVNRRPVGYIDVARFSAHPDTAELGMLLRTDMQRRGIGQAMRQETLHVLREEGVSYLEIRIHPDNRKIQNARQKWIQTEELRVVAFRRSIEDGEMSYTLALESQSL